MDISIHSEKHNFKFRVGAFIVQNNKLLVVKSWRFDGFIFPGGHVSFGETTLMALRREVKEEVGVEVDNCQLVCIHENLYKTKDDKLFNEIAYYYKVTLKNTLPEHDFELQEMDHGELKTQRFHWVDLNAPIAEYIRPVIVLKKFLQHKNNIQAPVTDEINVQ